MEDRTRVDGGNGKSSKLKCPSNYNPADFSAFLADLKAGTVYVDIDATTLAEGGVTAMGTAINKANCLSDTTALGFGFAVSDNPTINDVFKRIGADYITGTLTAGQTQLILTDGRFKTDSMIDIYCEPLTNGTPIVPTSQIVASGSLTLGFDAQTENVGVKVRVM